MDYAHHIIGAVYGTFLLFRQGTVCQPSCPAPNLYTYAQTNEFRCVVHGASVRLLMPRLQPSR